MAREITRFAGHPTSPNDRGHVMKLYSGPLSMFGAKAEIALREKGASCELEMVAFSQAQGYSPKHPEVLRVNPKRQVPALIDDDVEIFDSTQIFEYLEHRWPSHHWASGARRACPRAPARAHLGRSVLPACHPSDGAAGAARSGRFARVDTGARGSRALLRVAGTVVSRPGLAGGETAMPTSPFTWRSFSRRATPCRWARLIRSCSRGGDAWRRGRPWRP